MIAVSLYLLEATQSWVDDAEDYNHPSGLEAYQTSLNILDHFTSLSPDPRHESMQKTVANIANNAFSCAIRHGNYQMGVELPEQGRGILWNQLARFDISVAALESQGSQEHELGRKFAWLRVKLRKYAEGSTERDRDSYWGAQEEWKSVVDEIHHLDGFSRFPRRAAEGGPVIIVNASQHTCDAVNVLRTRPLIHVPLPCSFVDIDQLCSELLKLIQCQRAFGENRESWLKQTLRELWSSVVEPITSVLQNDIQLPLSSQIW